MPALRVTIGARCRSSSGLEVLTRRATTSLMSTTLAALALCVSPTVHDGDTLRCGGEKVRIANIDAPELPGSSKCKPPRPAYAWCDFRAGYASRDALIAFLAHGRVTIERFGTDPYGRTLATISVNGVDAGEYLVSRGLARPWR